MNALKITGLKKTYYPANVEALKGIDLEVKKGDFFGLLGPNGAGKTTIIGIITSLVNKSSGNVEVFDNSLEKNPGRVKKLIGVVPQEFNFNIFEKVIDILVHQAGYYGVDKTTALKRSEECLKDLELWKHRNKTGGELSGGMKRRLMIARAMIHNPKLLILDEPTTGVDIEIRRNMWDSFKKLNKKGMTIILTTHYLEEAESLCKNIAIIDKGKIIENTSTKELIGKLECETFILDLKEPLKHKIELEDYKINQTDKKTIEVEVMKEQDLNKLFKILEKNEINVLSMRNKSNRLEELFIRLVNGDRK